MDKAPKIKLKSTETLQAQTEAFLADNFKEFSDEQKLLLTNTSELAKITDLNNLPADLSEEIRELVEKNKDAYRIFLQEKRDAATEIEESIKIYNEQFRQAVQALKERIKYTTPSDMPEYLGEGTNGVAYKITVEGKDYAAKFSRSITQALFEHRPLKKATSAGIEHVSKFVCHSAEEGVTIMELLPGTDVTKFTSVERPKYTDENLSQLIDTVVTLESAGLVIDPKASNFLFDQENGFSVLDYHLQRENGGHITGKSLMSLMHALTYEPHQSINRNDPNAEEIGTQQVIKYQRAHLTMMVRVFQLVYKKYPELIREWQETYDKELTEYYYRRENRIYPQGRPYDPLIKRGLPDTEEFRILLQELGALGIKSEDQLKPSVLESLI